MAWKRLSFNSAFKAKVALEAIWGERTISEIAQKHKLHPTQINLWKKQLLDGAVEVFDEGKPRRSDEELDEPESAEL